MSIVNTNVTKQRLKVIEVPLTKFKEEVIPHHQKIFEQHKTIILKLISQNNGQQLRQEIKNKKQIIKQLKDLMYELDTLRAQVEDMDLDKFDAKTLSLRKIIINLISGYTDLEKRIALKETDNTAEKNLRQGISPFEGTLQIQLQQNLDELILKQQQELLNEVESVHRDTEDLKEIFTQLNEMVEDQREQVEEVEENVESARDNVHSGLRQLIKAHKLKTAAYPVTGAVLGTILGGPIGLIAGFKVGGIAALGCAVAGYTGGKFFKKNYEPEEIQTNKISDELKVENDTLEKMNI